MKTMQEIFNKAVTEVYRQGGRSMSAQGACQYRGENGRKCAVGHLIEDEHYTPALDDFRALPVDSDEVRDALIKSGVIVSSGDKVEALLVQLQLAHDSVMRGGEAFRTWFEERAADVAGRFGLSMPNLRGLQADEATQGAAE